MIYIIMGVSGCGKSTFGIFLSERLGWPLYEGDDFHPRENIEKMSQGEALTDQVCCSRDTWKNFGDSGPQEVEFETPGLKVDSLGGSWEDRLPWLLKLHEVIQRERSSGSDALVVCSALKHQYRRILLHGSKALTSPLDTDQEIFPLASSDVFFLFLRGDYEFIYQRMVARRGHYMKADMLRSQFDTLEAPSDEENVLTLDIQRGIDDMAVEVEKHLIDHRSSPV